MRTDPRPLLPPLPLLHATALRHFRRSTQPHFSRRRFRRLSPPLPLAAGGVTSGARGHPAAILGRLRGLRRGPGPSGRSGSLHGKMQRAGAEEAAGSQAAAGGTGRSGAGLAAAAPAGRLLKRELRLLESIFHRGHERFRIGSACPDEISCEFVPGAGARAGGSASRGPPPGPVRIHCNITVRAGRAVNGAGAGRVSGLRRYRAAFSRWAAAWESRGTRGVLQH